VTDDWNPNDPDASNVMYDLGGWSFDQQAELAAELAEADIPHTWDGSELVVPESHEAAADSTVTRVEARLGIVYEDTANVGTGGGGVGGGTSRQPLDIPSGAASTEYDLAEWAESDRQSITQALTAQQIPYRWEDDLLLVSTVHEEAAESLMDTIEAGEFAMLPHDAGNETELPFETLTTFFLAAERLQRNTLDADGLEQLLDALEVADPDRRPYGVELQLWLETCELADALAGALVDADVPDQETAMAVATDLHDLLRPYV